MKRRDHREWTARLSDYLSEELSEAERLAVEGHLAVCDECNRALQDLARLVDAAGSLGEIEPPRDLWPDIAAAIDTSNPRVIEFPGARTRTPAALPGRVELSRRGLVAASLALIALSAAATWWFGRLGSEPGVATAPASAPGDAVRTVAAGEALPPAMAGELAVLEDVLASARSVLDPNTVRVLERNLGVIEQAIADSREALAQDPGNAFLVQHLERMYRRKLVYLQDAVRLVEYGG
jgi:anti-sigma factor RsiW